MATINETITLRPNEGLHIEVSHIEWDTDGEERPAHLKNWMDCHFTATEIAAALGRNFANGCVTFTEDELEEYLAMGLSDAACLCLKGFRWMWNKTRTVKRAA